MYKRIHIYPECTSSLEYPLHACTVILCYCPIVLDTSYVYTFVRTVCSCMCMQINSSYLLYVQVNVVCGEIANQFSNLQLQSSDPFLVRHAYVHVVDNM